jgi:hypothetical protein
MKKHITIELRIGVGGGYAVRFDQRAAGQESPYWLGTIFKDDVEVGRFSNDGRGGMTHIHPRPIVEDFQKIARAAGATGHDLECESYILYWAEIRAYYPGMDAMPLSDFIRMLKAA